MSVTVPLYNDTVLTTLIFFQFYGSFNTTTGIQGPPWVSSFHSWMTFSEWNYAHIWFWTGIAKSLCIYCWSRFTNMHFLMNRRELGIDLVKINNLQKMVAYSKKDSSLKCLQITTHMLYILFTCTDIFKMKFNFIFYISCLSNAIKSFSMLDIYPVLFLTTGTNTTNSTESGNEPCISRPTEETASNTDFLWQHNSDVLPFHGQSVTCFVHCQFLNGIAHFTRSNNHTNTVRNITYIKLFTLNTIKNIPLMVSIEIFSDPVTPLIIEGQGILLLLSTLTSFQDVILMKLFGHRICPHGLMAF